MRARPDTMHCAALAKSTSMKIWIVNHYADPPDGLATRSYDIARRLVQRGHEVTIFASNFSHYHFKPTRELRGRPWRDEKLGGVRFIWIRTSRYKKNDSRRVLNMMSFAALAVVRGSIDRSGRPDAVVGVSVHPLAALAGWILAVARHSRFYFEVTDLWPQTLVDFGLLRDGSLTVRMMRRLETFLFRRAHRIIMLWRDTADYVEAAGGSRAKIAWVPHGVELEKYDELPPYDGGLGRPLRIMFLGGFVSANALDVLLKGAAVLQRRGCQDVRFVLVGAGTQLQELVSLVRDLGLVNVEFLPPVPKSEVPRVMVNADAFIYGLKDLPLYRYGISLNKLTDYLAGGRPIIFYGNSSYDPVADAGAGISVPPAQPEALADAVERLAKLSPEERQAMGRRGRQFLERHHAISLLAERVETILQPPPSARGRSRIQA